MALLPTIKQHCVPAPGPCRVPALSCALQQHGRKLHTYTALMGSASPSAIQAASMHDLLAASTALFLLGTMSFLTS